VQHAREPIEHARAEVAVPTQRLAQFDVVLRLEVAAAGVVRARKGHKAELATLVERPHGCLQRGVQCPGAIQCPSAGRIPVDQGDGDVGADVLIELALRGHEQAEGVVAATQEDEQEARIQCGGACGIAGRHDAGAEGQRQQRQRAAQAKASSGVEEAAA
jgi:hypothetical protein